MLNDPAFLYIATVFPPIFIGFIIWKSDRFPEPGKFLMASFLLGVSIMLPLDLLIILAERHLAPLLHIDYRAINDLFLNEISWDDFKERSSNAYGWMAYDSFFRAAFLEEGVKFALLLFFCVRLSALNEPMDAIVYGAAIGLGYAAIENVGYLKSGSFDNAWSLKMVKDRYYPMIMHLSFGVLMGWLLSQNLFEERSVFKRRLMLILSLSLPVILHGIYNYYGTVDTFPVLALIFIFLIIYYHRRDQFHYVTEDRDKEIIKNIDVIYSYLVTIVLVTIIISSSFLF